MRWKDVALIALVGLLLDVIRIWRGQTVEWLALVALFVPGYFVYRDSGGDVSIGCVTRGQKT